jgi:hypothetical protein
MLIGSVIPGFMPLSKRNLLARFYSHRRRLARLLTNEPHTAAEIFIACGRGSTVEWRRSQQSDRNLI